MADFTKEDFEEARREYKPGAQYTGLLERIDRIVLAALSLAAKASAEKVDGWKLVPVEPTAVEVAAKNFGPSRRRGRWQG